MLAVIRSTLPLGLFTPDHTGCYGNLVKHSSSVGVQLQYRRLAILWSGVWGTTDHESDSQEILRNVA